MKIGDFPVNYLWECFDVDFTTGDLTWKFRPTHHFETEMAYKTINSRHFGKTAGTIGRNGYLSVGLRGLGKERKRLYFHRVVYAMYHGAWPTETIDHFDGDSLNNKISNLRPTTQSINSKNQKLRSTNLSGLHGVRWYSRYNKWHVEGTYNSVKYHLGYYYSFFDAICARKSWELNKEFTMRHGTISE